MPGSRSLTLGATLLAALIAAPIASANTIHVPADYPTIQQAINAASSGDTILVDAGTYKENISLAKKNLQIIGAGYKLTTIDGQQKGSVVTIAGGQNGSTLIQGFTIRNGSGTKVGKQVVGGGIYIDKNSSPAINSNGIGFNNATHLGAGVYVGKGSKPTFNDDLFSNNFTGKGGSGGGLYTSGLISMDANRVAENGAPGGSGGGIYLNGVDATITNNTVTQNFANFGGGIQVKGGKPTISGNTIDHNTVLDAPNNGEGAGLGILGKASPLVTNNDFEKNTAHNGGGIYSYDSSPTITLNLLHLNEAYLGIGFGGGASFGKNRGTFDLNQVFLNGANQGGGVSARVGTTTGMYGNLVDTNTAAGSSGFGGGLYTVDSTPGIVANTFASNSANQGGGVYSIGKSAPSLDNSIVWGNLAGSDVSIFDGTGLMLISFSDIEAAAIGGSSLSIDPKFVDPTNRNFQLANTSPVIDAGDTGLNPPGNDLAGNARVVNGRIDMGAYEF